MTRLLELIPRTSPFLPRMNIFDNFFEDRNIPAFFGEAKAWIPAFDIKENEKEYVVTAELPGIDVKNLDITLSEGVLTVKGEKNQEKEEKGEDYCRVERQYGSFQRSFRIPGETKTDKVDATYKDGILKLVLPKAEAVKAKKIEVK